MSTTPLMNLELPTVTVTPGPDWATALNTALNVVDSHDHASGNGARITPSGLNINADLPMNQNNLTSARSLRLFENAAAIAGASDLAALYNVSGELYYNDGLGNQIQLTSGGGLNAASIGGIGGDYGSSSASLFYTSANQLFTFDQSAGVRANIDVANVAIRESAASANAVTLQSPSSLGTSYDITFPLALPASLQPLSISSTGDLSAAQLTKDQLAAVVQNALVPAGTVIASMASIAPAGYLYCDGSAVSRTTYANLFSTIGTASGEGDGSTTFNLPDLRGQFLRGQNDGSGADPDSGFRTADATGGNTGDDVGTKQGDVFGSHNHGGGNHGHLLPRSSFAWAAAGGSSTNIANLSPVFDVSSANSGTIINTEGGNETRPKNTAVRYYIKF